MSTSQLSSEQTRELAPILSEQWQMSWAATALVAWFSVTFLLINHTPLSSQETWQRASIGNQIVDSGSMAQQLPGVPLAEGMPYIAQSWLFDVGVFFLADRLGHEFVCVAIALLTSLAMWAWTGLIYRCTLSNAAAIVCAIVLGVTWANQYGALHSRLGGMLLFAILGWILVTAGALDQSSKVIDVSSSKLNAWHWLACAGLMVSWANIDASFWIGLLALATIAIGKAIDAGRTSGWRRIVSRDVAHWTWLTQLCAAATLLNPYGLSLWNLAATENLDSLLGSAADGKGLYLPSMQGATFLLLVAAIVWSLVQSTKPRNAAEIVLIAVLFTAAIVNASFVFWCVPVALLVIARHASVSSGTDEAPKRKSNKTGEESPTMLFAGTLCCGLMIWCGFALSTISWSVLGGKPRNVARALANAPLVEVGGYLKDREAQNFEAFGWTHQTNSFVWAPADWSDWLGWDSGVDVFVSSQLAQMPRKVQQDYWSVYQGDDDWNRILTRYAVDTLVVDKRNQVKLASEVMRHSEWKLMLETSRSLTLQRVSPVGGKS